MIACLLGLKLLMLPIAPWERPAWDAAETDMEFSMLETSLCEARGLVVAE